jgi:hypothetical protein
VAAVLSHSYAKEREHKAVSKRIDDASLVGLQAMYSELRAEINATPSVVVVHPGEYWAGAWARVWAAS